MVGAWLYGCGSVGCDPELPAGRLDDGNGRPSRRWKFGVGGPSGAGDSTPVVERAKVAGPWDCVFIAVTVFLLVIAGDLIRWWLKRRG